ncbi:hypothetical protein LTR91_022517 [Friedmanniomyces endolithicus]|uniref:Mitochondrial thiamine pyrophosphate carrier 1 n=1 Tax=Friedmanniomyces endolithicus TaxID=329885 RepID=A0A4U0UGY8_9PEZI|nr:hypothetical protein LTS09_010040 [Friedmanniomyces endolithicus]KAK0266683.1 hypothetical protein LTR35_016922 [Friedmanniomyces endolithicus]KAK0272403.1 hypothetical protein LTS00_016242 [Friedmanniomyces endolithicus]KAK0314031.1 hypothetical protein LTR82_013341 [Friedmanniomyces endolithicus]KAK0829447.1 hypothetical protein LTR73_004391 [Friedmanniomyces endolithicus]
MGYARAISPYADKKWGWRMLSPALLASAVYRHGWSFLPNQVLPPLMANTIIGATLYTSYLQALGFLHEPSARATKRADPLPSPINTFTAGFIAGSIQSLIAAPLDALQVRFHATEFVGGKYRNMWQYAYLKSREIGIRGVFAGWSLSLVRDSFGSAVFFSTFEYIKGQAFYSFVSNYYGHYGKLTGSQQDALRAQGKGNAMAGNPVITPHYMLEPSFILLAGVAASLAQAVIQYPVSRIQDIHYGRLEWIDAHSTGKAIATGTRQRGALGLYASAYRKTFKQCLAIARREGGLRRWLFRDFLLRTLTQVPSTSAGLIVFEVIRRKYGDASDVVKIQKDGYDILLV